MLTNRIYLCAALPFLRLRKVATSRFDARWLIVTSLPAFEFTRIKVKLAFANTDNRQDRADRLG